MSTDPRDPEETSPTGHDDEAEDRAAILRRRAVFIASAIAGLGIAAGCNEPQPCLSVVQMPADSSGTTAGTPAPCLTVSPTSEPPPPPPDAGQPESDDAGTGDAGPNDGSSDAGADAGTSKTAPRNVPTPAPCLTAAPKPPPPPPKPRPRPCLKMAPSDNE